MSLTNDIKQKAIELGFDLVGITDSSPIDAKQVQLFTDWLDGGYAGQMYYMHRNFDKRICPAKLLENAQSVIVVGLNYNPPNINMSHKAAPVGRVANYAQYEDYHSFIKKSLHRLTDFILNSVEKHYKFKVCVDSAPLAERALALRSGLGFIGKNHMLINPKFGPQVFLGEVVTTLKLESDKPATFTCNNCNKCIEACPTDALRTDGRFDANKCISYLTIEHKGVVPPESTELIGNRIFGCDECVLACPYYEAAPLCGNKQFKFDCNRENLNLQETLALSEKEFEERFGSSVISRLGLDRLKRNARICLKNSR